MARSTRPQTGGNALDTADEATAQVYDNLRTKIHAAGTQKELYAVVDDEFKAEVARLPEAIQRMLRDEFAVALDHVRGKVKMAELKDKAVIIKSPPNFIAAGPKTKGKEGVEIIGTVADTGEKFACTSWAVRIVRHFENSRPDSYPQSLTFYEEDADMMRARGAAPDTSPMWLVRRNAQPRERQSAIPF